MGGFRPALQPDAIGPGFPAGGNYLYPNMNQLPQQSPRQQKVALGESLYPHVSNLQPKRAAKITGMILEMPNSEVEALLQNPAALRAKVEEAVNVLNESGVMDDELE